MEELSYSTRVWNAVVVVQSLSHVRQFVTPWTAACQASLFFTLCWSLCKLKFIESVMPSNHLILCHPLFLLPSIFPSIRVFSNESALQIRWPKYWSFSFSISPSNEYSRLISSRIDWFDLLAVHHIWLNICFNCFSFSMVYFLSVVFFLFSPTLKFTCTYTLHQLSVAYRCFLLWLVSDINFFPAYPDKGIVFEMSFPSLI